MTSLVACARRAGLDDTEIVGSITATTINIFCEGSSNRQEGEGRARQYFEILGKTVGMEE